MTTTRCLLLLLATAAMARATSYLWLSPSDFVRESTLIAVLNVGETHDAFTPEGILVQSARATVEQIIYSQFSRDHDLPPDIVVYTIEPNATLEGDRAFFSTAFMLSKGRVLAILKQRGDNKFLPFHPLSLQELPADGMVLWPTTKGRNEKVPLSRVISEVRQAEKPAN